MEKVLVCITPQSNSRRLIQKAAAIVAEKQGELHILHIEKGENVFAAPESPQMLQELFAYGSQFGGVCHAQCGENVPEVIEAFIRAEGIAAVVFGEPPVRGEAMKSAAPTIVERVHRALPLVEAIVIPRD